MCDLPPHCQKDKDEEVDDQDRPEDRQVEYLAPCAAECNDDGTGAPVPELELGQSPYKWLELFVRLRWKGWPIMIAPFFHARVLF